MLCMSRNTVVSSYCVLIIVRQLKSLKFSNKENYFQTHAAGLLFVNLFSGERRESITDIYILLIDWNYINYITTGKRSWFIFQNGKGFIEMQLIYLADIFEDNYNIVRDHFETESPNVMKYMSLVAKKQRKFHYISLAQCIRQPWELSLGTTTLKSFVNHTSLWQTLERNLMT